MITFTVRTGHKRVVSLGVEFRRIADLLQQEDARTGDSSEYSIVVDENGHCLIRDCRGERIIRNPRSSAPCLLPSAQLWQTSVPEADYDDVPF